MAFPLSKKFLDKLREGKPEDSYQEPYVSRIDENDTEVCIDGWFALTDLEKILDEIIDDIPANIDWVLRVDGHTDNVPLLGTGIFRDNWELSQARALSVVRYMQDELGFPPQRLAATGFGEWQPVASGDSVEARAQNRRIELKLTDR